MPGRPCARLSASVSAHRIRDVFAYVVALQKVYALTCGLLDSRLKSLTLLSHTTRPGGHDGNR